MNKEEGTEEGGRQVVPGTEDDTVDTKGTWWEVWDRCQKNKRVCYRQLPEGGRMVMVPVVEGAAAVVEGTNYS